MKEQRKMAAIRGMAFTLESFLTTFGQVKESAAEIMPLIIFSGEKSLATMIDSSLSFFENICGENNENLLYRCPEEVMLYQAYMNQLCSLLHFWAIAFDRKSDPNEEFETDWKETFGLCFKVATAKNRPDLAKLFNKYYHMDQNNDGEFNGEEFLMLISEAKKLLAEQ